MNSPQPAFGHDILHEWLLEPGTIYLNHGTVGVTPRRVLDVQDRIRREIETHPSRFLLRELTPLMGTLQDAQGRLRKAAARIAQLVGGSANDLAFVDNATTGVNSILRSFPLSEGDQILVNQTTYGGVLKAAEFAVRQVGAGLRVAHLPLPIPDDQTVIDVFEQALSPEVKLAIIDHIVSETGAVLPIAELIRMCHAHGVRVIVDGAHAPGQLDLDLPSYGADWYVGNLHKWALAPRSTGILWASPEAQEGLHAAVVSWRLDEGMTREFDWMGTRDPSPWLAAPAGVDFLEELGIDRVRRWNHDTLWAGVDLLLQRWGGTTAAPRTMSASMIAVQLPGDLGRLSTEADALRDSLLFEDRIEVPVHAWNGRLWLRISVQVYNEIDDFQRLAEAIDRRRGSHR